MRLAPAGDVLMVGEGIETCLAAMQATRPSGLGGALHFRSAGSRSAQDVRDVIVLADGDEAGEAAARDAALRWKREGRRVRIAHPPEGMDFNDMLLGAAPETRGTNNERFRSDGFETEEAVAAAIDGAEEVRDPLEGLVERAATDPGAAFAPEVLERLAALKKNDRAAFETLRAQLKAGGLPGDRARQGSRRRERRYRRGARPSRPTSWSASRQTPTFSMQPTAPATPI